MEQKLLVYLLFSVQYGVRLIYFPQWIVNSVKDGKEITLFMDSGYYQQISNQVLPNMDQTILSIIQKFNVTHVSSN